MIYSVDIKDGQAWLTLTSENIDEWKNSENLFNDIKWPYTDSYERLISAIEKNTAARQISMRIDIARNRYEEEYFYTD